MIRKGKLLATIFFVLFTYSLAMGQDTLTVSLQKAMEIALSNNPTIKVADKDIVRIDYSKKEKFAALFPNITASGVYQRSIKKQRMFIDSPSFPTSPDGIEIGVDNTFTGGFSATLPIISPTLWASLRMTETDAKLVLETARSSRIGLVNQVTKAYYTILLSQDQYAVFNKSYQIATENARIILNKYKQGIVSEFEWVRADVQERNAKSNLVSAGSAVNMSKLQLRLLMGLDMNVGLNVEGKLDDFQKNMYSDVLKIDINNLKLNSDLVQMELKNSQLDQAITVQRTAWLPTLVASYNYSYMSMGSDGKSLHWFPSSTAGLQLSVPLFQGGARVYKQKQLRIQKDQMKDQTDYLRKSIEMQIINSMDNIKKALEKIESNKDGVRQAEKALSIAKKMYDVGSGTYLDLSNAELAYVTAGLTYNQSIFDYLSAKADLEKLMGKETK